MAPRRGGYCTPSLGPASPLSWNLSPLHPHSLPWYVYSATAVATWWCLFVETLNQKRWTKFAEQDICFLDHGSRKQIICLRKSNKVFVQQGICPRFPSLLNTKTKTKNLFNVYLFYSLFVQQANPEQNKYFVYLFSTETHYLCCSGFNVEQNEFVLLFCYFVQHGNKTTNLLSIRTNLFKVLLCSRGLFTLQKHHLL